MFENAENVYKYMFYFLEMAHTNFLCLLYSRHQLINPHFYTNSQTYTFAPPPNKKKQKKIELYIYVFICIFVYSMYKNCPCLRLRFSSLPACACYVDAAVGSTSLDGPRTLLSLGGGAICPMHPRSLA